MGGVVIIVWTGVYRRHFLADGDPQTAPAGVASVPSGPRAPRPAFPATAGVGERYTVLEEIGGGGAGTVFKAWDARLERVVALKLLDERIRTSPETFERRRRRRRRGRSWRVGPNGSTSRSRCSPPTLNGSPRPAAIRPRPRAERATAG